MPRTNEPIDPALMERAKKYFSRDCYRPFTAPEHMAHFAAAELAAALPVQHEASCKAMREACVEVTSQAGCVNDAFTAILFTPIPAYVAPVTEQPSPFGCKCHGESKHGLTGNDWHQIDGMREKKIKDYWQHCPFCGSARTARPA